MFVTETKLKFHHHTRHIYYLKLICILVSIALPIILLQYFLQSTSGEKHLIENLHHDAQFEEQIIDRGRSSFGNNSSGYPDNLEIERNRGTSLEQTFESGTRVLDNGQVGELFDVNQPLQSRSDNHEHTQGKSILRIRRNISNPQNLSGGGHSINNVTNQQGDENMVTASSESDRRTIVLVSSKAGKFNELVPLDELIIRPTAVVPSGQYPPRDTVAYAPMNITLATTDDLMNDAATVDRSGVTNLAELTAAGTAAGMLIGDLAARAGQNGENVYNREDQDDQINTAIQNQRNLASDAVNLDLSVVRPLNDRLLPQDQINLETLDGQQQPEVPVESSAHEQMPDSMDSLMKSEQEDTGVDGQSDSDEMNDPSASVQIQNDNGGGVTNPANIISAADISSSSSSNGDDEDDNDDGVDRQDLAEYMNQVQHNPSSLSNSIEQSTPNRQHSYIAPIMPAMMTETDQMIAPVRDSSIDLNAAAGHYYGKKKKKVKKILIKKKKKKKKVKKVKKVKKIKIVKYKTKKKVKKPKKHHHQQHHDHGKYYM